MPEANADSIRQRWEQSVVDPEAWESGDPTLTYKPRPEPGASDGILASLSVGAFLVTGDAPQPGAAAGTMPDGVTLPDHELVEKIGEGGMGIIWRARQASLAREVALKQAKAFGDDTEARAFAQQFVSEARVTGFLDHPNVVPVHTLGLDAAGRLFISMKLVQGTSWKDLLHPRTVEHRERAAKFDVEGHLDILMSVCNAVAFAHSRNVAHLDLKPSNIMVGDFGEVYVMDWGIAVDISDRAPSAEVAPAAQRTRHRTAMLSPAGTPAYLAPEMAEGRGPEIGPWTDVYLLGAILHEVVMGAPPHRGQTLSAVLEEAVRSGPKEYPAEVPGVLADICRKAMAKEPRDRYQAVSEFQTDLREYLKHRESMQIAEGAGAQLTRLESGDVRLRDTARRYQVYADSVSRYRQAIELWEGNEIARAGLREAALAYAREALAAGDLGLVAAQLELLPWEDEDGREMRHRVEAAAREAERKGRTERHMRVGIVSLAALVFLAVTVGFFGIRHEAENARQREKEATSARIRSEAERRRAVRQGELARHEAEKANAVLAFMQRMLSSADPERDGRDIKVLDLLDNAGKEIARSFRERPEIRAAVQHVIGTTFFGLGELERAEKHIRAAAATRAETLGKEHPDALASAFALASLEWKRGRYETAEREHRGVYEARMRILGAEHPDTLRSMTALASTLTVRAAYREAEQLLGRGLDAQKRVLGREHRDTLETMFDLISVLRAQHKTEEADAMLMELLEAERAAFIVEQPGLLASRRNLPAALDIQRRLIEAEAGLSEWLARRTGEAEGREHDPTRSVARVLRELSKGDESSRICRDIIVIRSRLLGPGHPRTIRAMHDLAVSLAGKENPAGALAIFRAVAELARRALGPLHPDTLEYERSLAATLGESGAHAEAEAALRALLDKQVETLGAYHPEVLRSKHALAIVLFRRGRYAEAATLWRGVVEASSRAVAGEALRREAAEWLGRTLKIQGEGAEADEPPR